MKNIFKFFSLALLAGSMMIACTPENGEDNNGGNGGNGGNGDNTKTYTVSVAVNDNAMGRVSISPVKSAYAEGDQVTITATANEGYNFVDWNGSITDNPYTFTVSGDVTYTANFASAVVDNGTVTLVFNGESTPMGGQDAYYYENGLQLMQAYAQKEGQSMYLPVFIVAFGMLDYTTAEYFQPNTYLELYYETVLENADGEQFPDWDYESEKESSINVTAFDANTMTLSCVMNAYMFDLVGYSEWWANNPESEVDPIPDTDYETRLLTATLSDVRFELYQGKMAKLRVK